MPSNSDNIDNQEAVKLVPPCPPHSWAHAPTVGYFRCSKCGERIEHSDPRYAEMVTARTTPAKLDAPDNQEEACRYCGREVLIGNLPGTGFLAVCGRRLAHAEACLPGGCHEAKNTRTLPSNEALAGDECGGLYEALTHARNQLAHLQMFPENVRDDATNKLLRLIDATLSRTPSSPQADEADAERKPYKRALLIEFADEAEAVPTAAVYREDGREVMRCSIRVPAIATMTTRPAGGEEVARPLHRDDCPAGAFDGLGPLGACACGATKPAALPDHARRALEMYDLAYQGIGADSFDGIEERYAVMLQEAHALGRLALEGYPWALSSLPVSGEVETGFVRITIPTEATFAEMGEAAEGALMSELGWADAGEAAWKVLVTDAEVTDWTGAERGKFAAQQATEEGV